MNDNAAIEEFAPYTAHIILRAVRFTGKLVIPAENKLPPIAPERVIGGLRRRDVTYKQWVTRACQRFADKHPDMATFSPEGGFTATPEQLNRLAAFVDRHAFQLHRLQAGAIRVKEQSSPYQRTAERCAPPPPIDKALVLSLLDHKMMRRRLETSDSKAALNAAILFLVSPKASKRSIPASELLPLINLYPDCPEETCYTLARLSSVHDIVPVGHILNAAELGWWQRVDVLLGRIERNHKPKRAKQAFPSPSEDLRKPIMRAIYTYVTQGQGKPLNSSFSPSQVVPLITGISSNYRIAYRIHAIRHFATEFGMPFHGGRYHLDYGLFIQLYQQMLTDKPR